MNKAIVSFGKNVKKIRVQNSLTQEKLAMKTGITVYYLSRIERGDANPSLEIVYKIQEALKCNWNELLD